MSVAHLPPHEPAPEAFGHPVARYLAATRPAFLSVTLVAVLLGLASAAYDGLRIDLPKAGLTLFFALCAHAGVNVINDYYDALNGSDAANTERLFPFTGGSRFIQNGVLSLRATAWFGYALLASVVPAGLWLAAHSAPGLIGIGLAGLVVGWAYSAPPLQLMCRGLGEVAIAAGWLLVVVGTDFVQRGTWAGLPVVLAVPYTLHVVNILYINQFPDRAADALAGKRTLVVRLGAERARWGYLAIALSAHSWLLAAICAGALPLLAGLASLTLIPALLAARGLIHNATSPAGLTPAIRNSIVAANLHGLLLAGILAYL